MTFLDFSDKGLKGAFVNRNQEIYRPGTAISDASNLCTAVGGDQNKEFKGNASFVRRKGVIYI